MKNYASQKTHRGRLAFRTPDRFIRNKIQGLRRLNPLFALHSKIRAHFSSRWEGRGRTK